MKKIIIAILVILLMTGCQNEEASKTFKYGSIDINKQYANASGSYVDLILKLPQIEGDYKGIPAINEYFKGLEDFYYNELPELPEDITNKLSGIDSGYYRSAEYQMELQNENIFSVSAKLDGGAGGVSWAGMAGATFNLDTGKQLLLDDIFNVDEDVYMSKIYDLVSLEIEKSIKESNESGNGNLYFFDDPYSGEGYKAIREAFISTHFYLTQDALVVFYDKYVLAAGAAGPLSYSIPYNELTGILDLDLKTP
ncbi:RsiV family protein [Fusibacter bizertensis]